MHLATLSLGIVSSRRVMTLGDLFEHLFSFGKDSFFLLGRVLRHVMSTIMGAVLV